MSQSLAKNSVSQAVMQVATIFFSMLVTVYFARILPKDEFSVMGMYYLLSSIFAVFTTLGIETTCIKEIPLLRKQGRDQEANSVLKTTIVSRIILSVIFSALLYIFHESVSLILFKSLKFKQITKILAIGVGLYCIQEGALLLGQVCDKFQLIGWVKFANEIGSRVAAFILYFVFGLEGYVIGFTCFNLITILILVICLRKNLFVRGPWANWFLLCKRSFLFWLRSFCRLGYSFLDQFLIAVLLTPDIFATYNVGKTLAGYIVTLSDAMHRPVTNYASSIKDKTLKRKAYFISVSMRIFTLVFAFVTLMFCLHSECLLWCYGGEKYLDAQAIMILPSINSFITVIDDGYATVMFTLGQSSKILTHDFLQLAVNFVMIFLVSSFGVQGYSFAKIISSLLAAIYSYRYVQKEYNHRFSSRYILMIVSVCIFVTALDLYAKILISSSLLLTPIFGILETLFYVFALCNLLRCRDLKMFRFGSKTADSKFIRFLNFFRLKKIDPVRFAHLD